MAHAVHTVEEVAVDAVEYLPDAQPVHATAAATFEYDPAVQAVVVATENATHAALAWQALQADKHVLVDYPLAATEAEVVALLDLARTRNRLLHVEAIGLLTAEHAWQKQNLADPSVTHVHSVLIGDISGWLLVESQAGRVGQLVFGRLLALDDLLGPLTVRDLDWRGTPEGWELTLQLQAGTRTATLVETRQSGRSRQKHTRLERADGSAVVPPPLAPDVGLFRRDLAAFVERVRDGGPGYVADEALVRVTRLAEAVSGGVG